MDFQVDRRRASHILRVTRFRSGEKFAAGARRPELRNWPRNAVSVVAEAVALPDKTLVSGKVSLISRSGCYFSPGGTFPPGATLLLRMEWHGTTFETRARVADAVAGDGMGLAFLGEDDSQAKILNRWIEYLSAGGSGDAEGLP
jgi:PilZ domain